MGTPRESKRWVRGERGQLTAGRLVRSALPQACRAEREELCRAPHPVGSTSLELLAGAAAAVLGICTIRILLALSAHRNSVTW